jgi:hypothetical protein
VALVALMAIALLGRRRERREETAHAPTTAPRALRPAPPDPVLRLSWRDAILAGALVAAVAGFTFALRAGAVLGPLTVLALRRGVTTRGLVALAIAAVALLPPVYLIFQPKDPGGYAFTYASDLLGAHWVADFAVACAAAASLILAWRWRRAASDLGRSDDAVPGEELARERDAGDEPKARPVAGLDAVDS